MNKKFYTHIIWDWNGTLFNDAKWCFDVTNRLLIKHNLRPFANVGEYRSVFDFPIIGYYEKIGFNLIEKPFEIIANEYLELYHANQTGGCCLHKNTQFVLEQFHRHKNQVILSASEKGNLVSQVNDLNIAHYFNELLGLGDIYAKNKITVGMEYKQREGIENAILIGDTRHDFDVAKELGIDCLLVANGHHNKEKLYLCGAPVLDDIIDVLDYIC